MIFGEFEELCVAEMLLRCNAPQCILYFRPTTGFCCAFCTLVIQLPEASVGKPSLSRRRSHTYKLQPPSLQSYLSSRPLWHMYRGTPKSLSTPFAPQSRAAKHSYVSERSPTRSGPNSLTLPNLKSLFTILTCSSKTLIKSVRTNRTMYGSGMYDLTLHLC